MFDDHIIKGWCLCLSCWWDTVLVSQNLKEDRVNLAHDFRAFSLWLAGFKAGTVEEHGITKLLTSQMLGNRGVEKSAIGEKAKQRYSPQGTWPIQRNPEVCYAYLNLVRLKIMNDLIIFHIYFSVWLIISLESWIFYFEVMHFNFFSCKNALF